MQHNPSFRAPSHLLALCCSLAACTTDTLVLGENLETRSAALGRQCGPDGRVEGDVTVDSQEQLAALEGCEEVSGDLEIGVFAGTDLSLLSSLRAVGGMLQVGSLDSAQAAIVEAGWLESLGGLESLERVGSLVLGNIAAPDLLPLSNLRFANAHTEDDRFAGTLAIAGAKNLVDLRGLERMTGVAHLQISDSPNLESLDGVALGRELKSITLERNEKLFDLSALGNVNRLSVGFYIAGTAVRDLNALSQLNVARYIYVERNTELRDASFLSTASAELISVSDNPVLEGALELGNVSAVRSLTVARNPQLTSLVMDVPAELISPAEVAIFPVASEIHILDNAQLESVSSVRGFASANSISVANNPSLLSLNLSSFEQLDRLEIRNNVSLSELALDAMRWVDVLDVRDNPLLPTAELRTLRSFESTLSGNADDPASE